MIFLSNVEKLSITCPNCGEVFDLNGNMSAEILKQIRDFVFEKDLQDRLLSQKNSLLADKEFAVMKAIESERKENDSRVSELQAVITGLKAEMSILEQGKELAVQQNTVTIRTEYMQQISDLKAMLEAKTAEAEYYKDLKSRLSTKAIGESLEIHCENEFNAIRMAAFPNAYFEKDNLVSETGSKGDYIFRDYFDGNEFVSIMFEMKNESDSAGAKKKNEHFFKELDKDRNEKKCEYAVLVSMLEPDSELYNRGIVDVSYRYPKMYVIRPQFFIPIITLLRNMSLNTISIRNELKVLRQKMPDISCFALNLDNFKQLVDTKCESAMSKSDLAVQEIDKAIKRLEAAKKAIIASDTQVKDISKAVEEITIEAFNDREE